ncbi:Hypothetical protein NF53_p1003 (plasmid) [Bacillus thuringiensis serovar indiana]|nr:Hypothetical protein NF53_p1003 [Bacillus thuringiensis serovar indiana]
MIKIIKKADELEKHQINISLKWIYLFYTFSLLGWSIYQKINTDQWGFQFLILCIGQIIFYLSLSIQKRKIDKLK